MSLSDYLHPTDHRLPEGWPNPRALMREPAAVAARMNEDGRRIASEKGDCTLADLTRLGWLQGQVQAQQASLISAWDKLDAEVAALSKEMAALRCGEAAPSGLAGDASDFAEAALSACAGDASTKEADADDIAFLDSAPSALADEDVAFGIERAA